MSNDNLYQVLGLERNATAEDIRKAYRKRALETHPDRLPQGVSEAERKTANERFRLVNNAYEVLHDEKNRKLYDRHGVWPPPIAEAQSQPGPSYSRTTSAFGPNPFETDPFFTGRPFGRPAAFTFTDPFELFDTLFADISHPRSHHIHSPFSNPFFSQPSPLAPRDPWGRSLTSPFDPFSGHSLLSSFLSSSSMSQSTGSGGQWVSESTVTQIINGRRETVTKRRDAQGNEHVTHFRDGVERYTVNGVEQPAHQLLPSSTNVPRPLPEAASSVADPVIPTMPRSHSRQATAFYDQGDVSRRSSGSSHRKLHEGGHRSSRDGHESRRSYSHHGHDLHSSTARPKNKVYSGAGHEGHQVGDGTDHIHDRHGKQRRQGW